jgi:ankyrin repeat protein
MVLKQFTHGSLLLLLGLSISICSSQVFAAETLQDAATYDLQLVKRLVNAGHDVNAKDRDGHSALYNAVNAGESKIVEFLLSRGADVNFATESRGTTALHRAANDGDIAIAKLLIKYKADVNAVTKKRFRGESTPLLEAAGIFDNNKSLTMVSLLLENGATVNVSDSNGWTPLHAAVEVGNISAAKLLLSKGASVSAQTDKGYSPLHLTAIRKYKATYQEREDMIKLLVSNGASLDAVDKKGLTPLKLAKNSDNLDSFKILAGISPGKSQAINIDENSIHLVDAACKGDLETVKSLLKAGANINHHKENGWTALQCAVNMKKWDTANYLLDNNAKVDIKQKNGDMVLHGAARYAKPELVKKILDKGANINAQTKYYGTPLCMAVTENNTAVVKLLLERGADVNAVVGGSLDTPLHIAANDENTDILKMLLSKKPNLNPQDKYGRTPLHRSVYSHGATTKLLLDSGADRNIKDKKGLTPLATALKYKQYVVAGILKQPGSK